MQNECDCLKIGYKSCRCEERLRNSSSSTKIHHPIHGTFDATPLWNKATELHPLETNGYWKALKDLSELGVVKLLPIDEG